MLLDCTQRTDDWLNLRKGRITASLAAACLGLDPHTGPLGAFNQITGRSGGTDNRHTRWGTAYEKEAISTYEMISGNLVRPTGFWVHDQHNWLGASPDGLVCDDAGLLEVKCPGKLPDGIPLHHRIQMLVQLACTGRQWCDYLVWVPNQEPLLRRVNRCQGIEGLVRSLKAWWENYLVLDVPPSRKGTRSVVRKARNQLDTQKAPG